MRRGALLRSYGTGIRLILVPVFIAAEYSGYPYTALGAGVAAILTGMHDTGNRSGLTLTLAIAVDCLLALSGLSMLAWLDIIPGFVPATAAIAFATYALLHLDCGVTAKSWLGRHTFLICFALITGIQTARIISPALYLIVTAFGPNAITGLLWLCVVENLARGVWQRGREEGRRTKFEVRSMS